MKNAPGIIFLILLIATKSFGQSPDWTLPLDEEMKFFLISPSGNLLVFGEKTLYSIDPQSHSVEWKTDKLGNINEESFVQIEDSHLYSIKSTTINSEINILNSLDGTLLFNSQEAGFTSVVFDKIMWDLSGILIEGIINEEYTLSLIDLQSGKIRWSTKISDKTSVNKLSMLRQVATPLLDGQNNLYYCFEKEVIKINTQNGALVWRAEAKKKIRIMSLSPDGSKLTAAYGSMNPNAVIQESESTSSTQGLPAFVTAFSGTDGTTLLSKPVKLKTGFSKMIANDDHFYAMDISVLQKFTYTGEEIWKKAVKISGTELMTFKTDKGLFTAIEGWKINLKYIDEDGNSVFREEPKIQGTIKTMEFRPEGLFYIADEANIIDMASGAKKLVIEKGLHIGSSALVNFDAMQKVWLFLSGDELIEVDHSTAISGIVAKKIELDPVDPIQSVEKIADGYILLSAQGIRKLDQNGHLVYAHNYEAPPVSAAKRFLYGTISSVGSSVAQAKKYGALANSLQGNGAAANKSNVTGMASEAIGNQAEALKNRKIQANASAQHDVLILTTSETKGELLFVQINKATGEEVKRYALEKMNPVFILDAFANKFYYGISEKEIACVQLN